MQKINSLLLSTLSLICGLALPLAFAPFNFSFIGWLAPAVLLYCWLNSTRLQLLLSGFIFGMGFFGVGTSWVYVSIHQFGNANAFLAGLITLLFVIVLSLFTTAQAYCFSKLKSKSSLMINALAVFPSTWVLWEWIRSWLFTGFPWLFLGYSQLHDTLRGFAPLVGVYGISLITTIISGLIVILVIKNSWRSKITVACIALVLFIAGMVLNQIRWTQPLPKSYSVSLVQGNIGQQLKWNPKSLIHILQVYQQQTEQHWSQIIVWPEAAIPLPAQQVQFYLKMMAQQATQHHSAILLGIPTYQRKNHAFYNSIMVLGKGKGQYNKRHLVPFGEYIPLQSLFNPVMNYFNIPLSTLAPGQSHQQPIVAQGIKIAPFICYEIAYPQQVIKYSQHKQMLVVVSDDSWFGQSFASAQQLQMAQMRALATGRYILYATNTGITAVINPQGKIKKYLPRNRQQTLVTTVRAYQGKTPLLWWGFIPVMVIVIIFLPLGKLTDYIKLKAR